MTSAEKYVTAAYLVFLGVLLLYVVIYSSKIARLEREVAEFTAEAPANVDEAETEQEKEKGQTLVA